MYLDSLMCSFFVNFKLFPCFNWYFRGIMKAKERAPKLKIIKGLPSRVVKYGMDGTVKKLKLVMQQATAEKAAAMILSSHTDTVG